MGGCISPSGLTPDKGSSTTWTAWLRFTCGVGAASAYHSKVDSFTENPSFSIEFSSSRFSVYFSLIFVPLFPFWECGAMRSQPPFEHVGARLAVVNSELIRTRTSARHRRLNRSKWRREIWKVPTLYIRRGMIHYNFQLFNFYIKQFNSMPNAFWGHSSRRLALNKRNPDFLFQLLSTNVTASLITFTSIFLFLEFN